MVETAASLSGGLLHAVHVLLPSLQIQFLQDHGPPVFELGEAAEGGFAVMPTAAAAATPVSVQGTSRWCRTERAVAAPGARLNGSTAPEHNLSTASTAGAVRKAGGVRKEQAASAAKTQGAAEAATPSPTSSGSMGDAAAADAMNEGKCQAIAAAAIGLKGEQPAAVEDFLLNPALMDSSRGQQLLWTCTMPAAMPPEPDCDSCSFRKVCLSSAWCGSSQAAEQPNAH